MTEFNLSEELSWTNTEIRILKEFIKRLKEDIKAGMIRQDENSLDSHWDIHDLIDKLAGDKLK